MTLVQFQVQRAIQPYQQTDVIQKTEFLEQPVYQLTGHSGAINECHFSLDGKILATVAGEVILWSVGSKVESIGALRPHKSPITSLSWSIDGSKFATSSADQTVAVQDTLTGKVERRFKNTENRNKNHISAIVNTVCFSRENPNVVISGDDDGNIFANDLRASGPIAHRKSNSPITSIAINNNRIAVAGVCGSIFIDTISGNQFKMDQRLEPQENSLIYGIAIEPTGRYLAANDSNGVLTIFNILDFYHQKNRIISQASNGTPTKEIVPPRTAWSPDGHYVMSGSTDRLLRIWDVEAITSPMLVYQLPGHTGTVTGCDFHPSLPIVVSGSTDGTVIVGELGK
ncbi:U5 small nuclear ribonucleoprotein 40 kDa protein [Tritrichomonas foetus]|uniref:U5 small nuclear ribonucleoprotein 40 kDa protein n=1 Tax=Tritrichomonas foetus TaxID=1144522 RepID=A0A1J4JR07_9EUKA|nr:U5 small nuclear ribonucleoprotein 40 kDa protein [Tritrichomonas foetus]|eukprot:OHT01467.1 U5 small nuclear ribonucleoprotein 40 kDa protein [Tritrichomonas foetus]